MSKQRGQPNQNEDATEPSEAAGPKSNTQAGREDSVQPGLNEENAEGGTVAGDKTGEAPTDEEPIRAEPIFEPAEHQAGGAENEERLAEWEALQSERDGLVEEREQLRDQLLRARAEFDNYRKRVNRDTEHTRKMAAEALVRDLLPILDNLELAVEHSGEDAENAEALREGVNMVLKQMHDVLRRHGVEPIESLKAPFDPNVHEALMQTHSDEVPADHVAQVFQKGYKLGDQILRPAKVVVSQGPAAAEEKTQEQDTDAAADALDESPPESAKIRRESQNDGG